jgi:hypothetical protein
MRGQCVHARFANEILTSKRIREESFRRWNVPIKAKLCTEKRGPHRVQRGAGTRDQARARNS